MHIEVNNEVVEIEQGLTLAKFLEWYQQTGNFAVAINMEFVPRSLYSERVLNESDKIEIVEPMQGG